MVLFAGIAAAALLAWWKTWELSPGAEDIASHGAFGDAFAPVVGLFSSLALGAAVLSVFIQREELQATRAEAEEQRKATQRLANATEKANSIAAQAEYQQLRSQLIALHSSMMQINELGCEAVGARTWGNQLGQPLEVVHKDVLWLRLLWDDLANAKLQVAQDVKDKAAELGIERPDGLAALGREEQAKTPV